MRIFVDIDDCLNDMKTTFIQRAVDLGYIKEYQEIKEWDLTKFFKSNPPLSDEKVTDMINSIFLSDNFWLNLPLKEDAVKVVKWLNNKHEIYLATSPWYPDPDCMKWKVQWVEKYFSFLKTNQLIFISKKWLLKGDIIIDDKPITIKKFDGVTIIFDQPYNQKINANYRVNNWKQVLKIIQKDFSKKDGYFRCLECGRYLLYESYINIFRCYCGNLNLKKL